MDNSYFYLNYKNITLKVSSLGGEVKSFQVDKKEIIHQEDNFWKGSSTHLFPIVGKLKDNKTKINNNVYEMTGHGFIRHSQFDLIKKTKKTLTIKKDYDEETLNKYPYKFSYIITYKVGINYLITKIKVVNKDNKAIYFNIGEHPGINLKNDFSNYKVLFNKKESFKRPFVNSDKLFDFSKVVKDYNNIKEIGLNYDLFENDAILNSNVKSKKIKLLNKEKRILQFSFSNFKSIAFWSVKDSKFICFEPWNGYADIVGNCEFLNKPDLIKLVKGSIVFKTKIKLFNNIKDNFN